MTEPSEQARDVMQRLADAHPYEPDQLAAIDAALAEAWDRGHRSGRSYEYVCQALSLYGEPLPAPQPNPYRRERSTS